MNKQFKVLRTDPGHPDWKVGQTVSLPEAEGQTFLDNGTLQATDEGTTAKPPPR